jgi:hypothetical protein
MKELCAGWSSEVIGTLNHYFMNDFDKCKLYECILSLKETMKYAKEKYNVIFNDISIFSDKINSYRALSFTELTYNQLHDLLSTCKYTDSVFIGILEARNHVVIRYTTKMNREINKVVYVIKGEKSGWLAKDLIVEEYFTEVDVE